MSKTRDDYGPGHSSGRMQVRHALARTQVEMANLIPGKIEPPNFRTDVYTVAAESAEFELFLDRHFPRTEFGELRETLDKASRSKATFYRSIIETRRLLRSAAIIMDWYAGLENGCPALRICSVCGRIFSPARKDQMSEKKCGNLVRQRRKRERAKQYELNRELGISRKNDRQKLKKKGAVK
jgi:hypothetical protein